MKTLLTILLLVGNAIFAQIPSKLDDLKAKKDAAIKRIEDVYKDELKKLLADPFIKGDPGKLGEVLKELGQDVPNDLNAPLAKPGEVNLKEIERRFVNKAWKTPFGTTFHFEKNGQGWKTTGGQKTPFTWQLLPDGILEYNGRVTTSSPVKTEYFIFNSKKDAFNGKDKQSMTTQLTLVD